MVSLKHVSPWSPFTFAVCGLKGIVVLPRSHTESKSHFSVQPSLTRDVELNLFPVQSIEHATFRTEEMDLRMQRDPPPLD